MSGHSSQSEPAYRILAPATLPDWLAGVGDMRALLGGRPVDWRVREVGDGNLNLVFIVEGPDASVCVKQALPYVRAAGPSWPMSPQRAYYENAYYRAVAPRVGALLPRIHHYDGDLYCTVMERLSPHVILRQGLIGRQRYPRLGRDVGQFVARACFFTSDLGQPMERKMEAMALFAGNSALVRISVDLIFTDPYAGSARNRHTSPQLDAVAAALRADAPLTGGAARCGWKFLTEAQALLHGDLHSGSLMVTAEDTRVIDPEFAFYGPIGFDLGAFLGNLLLNWYAQPGHGGGDACVGQRQWLLEQAAAFWESFRSCFLALWSETAGGDAFPAAAFARPADKAALDRARAALLDTLFADMQAFAACKMIRRIVGFAHVADFESIIDPGQRAAGEAGALALARWLLTAPEACASLAELQEAVQRFALDENPASWR